MLTRLKVRGFKNLVDVDIPFGPFTCIAGRNAVGKSNLFDAITFLSALADKTFLEAARSIRDEGGQSGDPRSLFHRAGTEHSPQMSFEAEMIVPSTGRDELGQEARAQVTFLKYELTLEYRPENGLTPGGGVALVREQLMPIKKGDATKHLLFPHVAKTWRASALKGRDTARRSPPFISTEETRVVKIHQDGTGGRVKRIPGRSLPRTALSSVNAIESPTATQARNEMRSWRLLQLEPTKLRSPDRFLDPPRLGSDGAHLAATAYRLAQQANGAGGTAAVYTRIANRLAELIEDVDRITVDRDEKRELLTLFMKARDGTLYPARDLSDGTLRFLALVVLEQDPDVTGVICLEEPENGIHPARIPAMMDLLESIAVDTEEEVGPDNPLRQVIVNTHSPALVAEVGDQDLLFAERVERVDQQGRRFYCLGFRCLPGTWRAEKAHMDTIPRGQLADYLNYARPHFPDSPMEPPEASRKRRVIDRGDLQPSFPFEA